MPPEAIITEIVECKNWVHFGLLQDAPLCMTDKDKDDLTKSAIVS